MAPLGISTTAGRRRLRDSGVLVIGSGYMTHGLPYIGQAS